LEQDFRETEKQSKAKQRKGNQIIGKEKRGGKKRLKVDWRL